MARQLSRRTIRSDTRGGAADRCRWQDGTPFPSVDKLPRAAAATSNAASLETAADPAHAVSFVFLQLPRADGSSYLQSIEEHFNDDARDPDVREPGALLHRCVVAEAHVIARFLGRHAVIQVVVRPPRAANAAVLARREHPRVAGGRFLHRSDVVLRARVSVPGRRHGRRSFASNSASASRTACSAIWRGTLHVMLITLPITVLSTAAPARASSA